MGKQVCGEISISGTVEAFFFITDPRLCTLWYIIAFRAVTDGATWFNCINMLELSNIQLTEFQLTSYNETTGVLLSLFFGADPRASWSRNLTIVAVPWAMRENAERNGSLRSTVSLAIFTELHFLFKHTLYCEWTPGLTSRVLFLSLVSVLVSASQLDLNPSTI